MRRDPSLTDTNLDSFPDKLRWLYAQIRLLSLDVVAGAVGGGLMVERFVGAEMGWPFHLVLGLCVWLIYTLDHLLDAQRLGAEASTDRHRYHHKYFKPLWGLWVLLAVLAGGLAFWKLGRLGIYFGVGMGGLTMIHLLLVKLVGDKTSPFLTKEMGVALVYSAGIWGLPVLRAGVWDQPLIWIAFSSFFLLATVNLLEFSLYEVEIDQKDGHTSFVRALGKGHSRVLVKWLLVHVPMLLAAGIALIFLWGPTPVGLAERFWRLIPIFVLMTVILSLLLFRPRYFEQHERYRVWGDGAFLLPFLSLCLLPA